MRNALSRRRFLGMAGLATLFPVAGRAQSAAPDVSAPIGIPGSVLGDGFDVRIAYAAENARYYPGWWHTGENWHRLDDDTAGAGVYAVADGEVVYAGSDYPGLVVIIAHAGSLYSIYGHLDHAVAVKAGQRVARGAPLGTVLARADDYARSHLHFELRTFLVKEEINGDVPQHGVSCGYQCPPGPGYWPIDAPEHPSDLGWLNPTHVINRRAWPGSIPPGTDVIVAEGAPASVPLWTLPAAASRGERLGDLALVPSDRYSLLAVVTGEEAATGTSAEATRLWYRLRLPEGRDGWVQAAVPDRIESGNDGRPSSLRFHFLPAVVAA